jgi:hypothetical protein
MPISPMTKQTITRVSPDGLRYTSKAGGSPFFGRGNTRSCFKCGRHRSPDQLRSVRLLGAPQMVCKPSCAELLAMQSGSPAMETTK